MKTKTLFLSLLAGAFLCFSTASYAQYHHSGGGGSSGDGAFGEGTNVIAVGVGFGGGLAAYSIPDYTTSAGIGLNGSFEHALNDHWGIGLTVSSANSSLSSTSSYYDYSTTPPTSVTETDKYTLSILGFTVRGYYHFAAGAKFDPYIGIGLGYGSVSSKWTQSFSPSSYTPYYPSVEPGISIAAAMGGVFLGARYYVTDHIGIWAELQWEGYLANLANAGLAFKF